MLILAKGEFSGLFAALPPPRAPLLFFRAFWPKDLFFLSLFVPKRARFRKL
jgi:hypothetical protein